MILAHQERSRMRTLVRWGMMAVNISSVIGGGRLTSARRGHLEAMATRPFSVQRPAKIWKRWVEGGERGGGSDVWKGNWKLEVRKDEEDKECVCHLALDSEGALNPNLEF